MTGKAAFRGHCVSLFQNVGVIVRKLFSGKDVTNCLDPDATVIDNRVAIGIARMVDKARCVSSDCGIDYNVVVDCKEIGVMSLP